MKIVSIDNLKGGPGKTTTAINMAYVLAEKGKRVLILDNDPQGNSSTFFGYKGVQPNINDVYMSGGNGEVLRAAIRETKYKNLSILPSTDELAGAIIEMSKNGEITVLRDCLQGLEKDFDFIVIDNSAQMTANVVNAIVASDDIIVPAEVDSFNMDGLDEIRNQIKNIKMSGLNDTVKFAGMLITRYNGRTKIDREGAKILRSNPENKVFETMISLTIKVKEAAFQQVPLVRYDKKNTAAINYVAFVEEYLQREGE